MFWVRKIVGAFVMPVALGLGMLLAAAVLLLLTRKRRTGKVLLGIGVVFLTALSWHAVGDALLRPLEYRYAPLTDRHLADLRGRGRIGEVKWIVVLGGGHTADDALPVAGQASGLTLVRVTEGVRLYRKFPGSKLLLSGGSTLDDRTDAEYMVELARTMGVPAADIEIEDESRNTAAQARNLQDRLPREGFLLVTSAFHMPRSMALFEKQGLQPIPAPAGHFTHRNTSWSVLRFVPSSRALVKSHWAFYETIALLWARIRGQA